MSKPTVGKKVAPFKAVTTVDSALASRDLLGKPYVLYFYPKDDTPGCTLEGKDFRDRHAEFGKVGVRVLGVSRDSLTSHAKFKGKYDLPFELVSDADEALCKQFDVIKDKNMYGKKVRGIERSTFAIDPKGVVRREWRGVKVPGHVEEVLEFVRTLK
jgi:thioredoxin-dependent peroxiredoxin